MFGVHYSLLRLARFDCFPPPTPAYLALDSLAFSFAYDEKKKRKKLRGCEQSMFTSSRTRASHKDKSSNQGLNPVLP